MVFIPISKSSLFRTVWRPSLKRRITQNYNKLTVILRSNQYPETFIVLYATKQSRHRQGRTQNLRRGVLEANSKAKKKKITR